MACDETTIAFSGEDMGWHVIVDGPMTEKDANRLVEVVTRQIGVEVDERCEWLRYD